GGRVIGLPRRAQRRTGREVNNPTALLLAHQGRRRTDGAEVALQVYSDHRVPLFLGHVEDHAVAQDAGAVHQNVELPEGIDRRLDQTLSAFDGGDVVGIGYGLAAGLLDFLPDLLGRSFVRPFTVDAGAEVVDHDLGPFLRHQQRDTAPDPPARAGNGRNFAVEFTHILFLLITAFLSKTFSRPGFRRKEREPGNLGKETEKRRIGESVKEDPFLLFPGSPALRFSVSFFYPFPLHPFASPSTRSPKIPRWISDVPPPMVSSRPHSAARGQRPWSTA